MNMLYGKTAILVVDWCSEISSSSHLTGTPCLLPLLGKPILQIAMETLVRIGCREFHVLLGENPTAVREFLGSGERWGVRISYHYRRPEFSLSSNLKHLPIDQEDLYWLACPERIPGNLLQQPLDFRVNSEAALCWQTEDGLAWTGWGRFTGKRLLFQHKSKAFTTLEKSIIGAPGVSTHITTAPYDVSTNALFLRSNLQLLTDGSPSSGQFVDIGRGAVVHPTAKIIGPAYIGQQARIQAEAELGPNIVIGDGAIIDHHVGIVNSIVLPDTYVGAHLELNQIIAAPGKLASITNNVVLNRIEPQLLASVSGRREILKDRKHALWAAWILKILLFPLNFLTRIVAHITGVSCPSSKTMHSTTPSCDGNEVNRITIPIANTIPEIHRKVSGAWISHFIYTFYPGLDTVIKGQLALFGPELRDADDIEKLPEYWKILYRQHKAGLLSESLLTPAEQIHHSSHYACDAYAITEQSNFYQGRILFRYLSQVVKDLIQLKQGRLGHSD